MPEGFTPRINLNDRMEHSKISSTRLGNIRTNSVEQPETTDFKSVFSGLVENLNQELNAPDEITKDALAGKADVHDVMAAIAKSEIQMNIATTTIGKVLQTYEKIMQIQI
jgi:flagellar hook-basal body complex protein FliE